jgi:CTP-dependent riboflavin kinase
VDKEEIIKRLNELVKEGKAWKAPDKDIWVLRTKASQANYGIVKLKFWILNGDLFARMENGAGFSVKNPAVYKEIFSEILGFKVETWWNERI